MAGEKAMTTMTTTKEREVVVEVAVGEAGDALAEVEGVAGAVGPVVVVR